MWRHYSRVLNIVKRFSAAAAQLRVFATELPETTRIHAFPDRELPVKNGVGIPRNNETPQAWACSGCGRPPPKSGRVLHAFARQTLLAQLVAIGFALTVLCVVSAANAEEASGLRLAVDSPRHGEQIATADGRVFVSGRALAPSDSIRGEFDVTIVIDLSASTRAASGADVDGDGKLGRGRLGPLSRIFETGSTDAGDNVLAAEVAAARTLLGQLDPLTTQVGLLVFAGDGNPDSEDAQLLVPLTDDYDRIHENLDRILRHGPGGRTNMFAAAHLASVELTGAPAARSSTRPGARKVVLFMTDGQPTSPGSAAKGGRMAVAAAERGGALGVRFDTFAIGAEANRDPKVLRRMAEVSGGSFTAVRDPKDLIAAFREIRLADIDELTVRNTTTRSPATYTHLDPDGWFSSVVDLAEGANWLEIRARSKSGHKAVVVMRVELAAGDQPQPLSARLLRRRKRLLESQLGEVRARRVEIEAVQNERVRRELQREMAAERARREKNIRIEVDEAVPAAPE